MILEDLVSELQSVRLYPIQVESCPDGDDFLSFVGTLGQYLSAAKAIGSTVTFISTMPLTSEHFLLESEEQGNEGVRERDEKSIDLRIVSPSLSQFDKKIGVVGYFQLWSPMPPNGLAYAVIEDWWQDFIELRKKAIEIVKNRNEAAQAALDAADEEQEQLALKKLHALINDKDFVRLPTQRAMRQYAVEKVPELETLDESDLKRALQDVNAKILAKGIGRK